MSRNSKLWLHGLVGGTITGAAQTVLGSLGVKLADLAGMQVPPLDFKQTAILFASGGLVGALAWLRQSPLPPIEPN
jgi:hypothetical protein